MTLLAFIGVSACFGGGLLIADPSGRLLALPASLLETSPFENYLIPGIVLFVLLGGGSFLTLAAVIRNVPVAPFLIVANGVCITSWILVQITMIETILPQQLVIGFIGLLLVALGVLQWDQHSAADKR
ncbi:MAG: hypothetical protein WEB33_07885 [Bacteroidota bacterium]